LHFFCNDIVTEINALVANKDRRTRNQFADLMLALTAKRAVEQLAVVFLVFLIAHVFTNLWLCTTLPCFP